MQTPDIRLDVYDHFGGIGQGKLFAARYGAYPSEVDLAVDYKRTEENLEGLYGLLDLDTHKLRCVIEDGTISRTPGEDDVTRPYSLFFLAEDVPLGLHLSSGMVTLSVTFYYDSTHEGLGAWCRAQLLSLRERHGKPERPRFHVLTSEMRGFDTESIEIDELEMALDTHYNDDFAPVDADIRTALDDKERSGLILLHGDPGTGKTSYIKHLIAKFPKTEFIFVPNDMVQRLLQPEFVSFMVTKRRSVLVIEDAEKVIQSRENTGESSVVSTILQLTDGLFSDYLSVKVVCTFNTDVSRIDPALFRKGRLIAFYEFRALVAEKTEALVASLGKEVGSGAKALTLAEIYNLDGRDYEAGKGRKIGF